MRRYHCLSVLSLLATSCSGGGSAPGPLPASLKVNNAPAFSSPDAVAIDENALGVVYVLSATDSDGSVQRVALAASADANSFSFNASTGRLSLPARLSHAGPADADANNIYELTFEAEDNDGAVSRLNVRVTVTEAALKAGLPPSGNFELIDWKLELPVDANGNFSGANASIGETELANGYESEFFFTGPDGGMVLRAPVIGATTPNSSYARTELREMLRRGDTSISTRGAGDIPNRNNWALSSQPLAAQVNAGGVDGTLRVTLAVNNVTATGASSQIGRLIIGQIHAKDDEPVRLYYRKLPANTRGAIYAEHEISGGADARFEIIGSSANDAADAFNGFRLNEKFSYEITADGNLLTVAIFNDTGQMVATKDIDMSASGYDVLNDFMYFKAGAYHVNSTANPDVYAQVTIYELKNTHTGYPFQ